jgi:hypothetical protein
MTTSVKVTTTNNKVAHDTPRPTYSLTRSILLQTAVKNCIVLQAPFKQSLQIENSHFQLNARGFGDDCYVTTP